jgi:hypothetical protein
VAQLVLFLLEPDVPMHARPRLAFIVSCALALAGCPPPVPDAGEPEPDAGEVEPDAGEPEPDGGEVEPDAGEPEPDGGEVEPDAGEPEPDGGEPEPDAGEPEPDAGEPEPDGGAPDGGLPLNACGGTGELPDLPGAACGPCGGGRYECSSLDTVNCEGALDEVPTLWPDLDLDGFGDEAAVPETTCFPTGSPYQCDAPFDSCAAGAGTCLSATWGAEPQLSCVLLEDTSCVSDPTSCATPFVCNADLDDCAVPAAAGFSTVGGDCDDSDPERFPGNVEVCDAKDNDCANGPDDGLTFADYWPDDDGDRYGAEGASPLSACVQPAGHASQAGDCNDNNPSINPSAPEVCDGIDNDCASGPDDGLAFVDYRPDADLDSHGDALAPPTSACAPPDGMVATTGDCNDDDPTIHPGALERCNGVDENCAEGIDDEVVPSWFKDADRDGFGDPAAPGPTQCTTPPPLGIECREEGDTCAPGGLTCRRLAATRPPSPFFCVQSPPTSCTKDDDCDVLTTGIGCHPTPEGSFCFEPANTAPAWVTNSADCDDTSLSVRPGATEVCDAIDNDCDGAIDEGFGAQTWYVDVDTDSFGDFKDPGLYLCPPATPPSGTVTNNDDCDDANPAVFPGMIELCDGIDNDCDTATPDSSTAIPWYPDADGDLRAQQGSTDIVLSCDMVEDRSPFAIDCDDTDPDRYPGNPEVCDGKDNDCVGGVDDGVAIQPAYLDLDGDGYGTGSAVNVCLPQANYALLGGDCDDSNPAIHPGATEVPGDEVDGDCNGAELCYQDLDDDLFHGSATITSSDVDCQDPGEASPEMAGGDCDDGRPDINPVALDLTDDSYADENCDGIDGDAARTLFVDRSVLLPPMMPRNGTRSAPYASVQQAIAVADASYLYDHIAINEGTYEGPIYLESGVSLTGGYSRVNGWARSPAYETTIENLGELDPSAPMLLGVAGVDLIDPTILRSLTIRTGDAPPSFSSKAIYLRNTPGVTLVDLVAEAGAGGDGVNGLSGAQGFGHTSNPSDQTRGDDARPGVNVVCPFGNGGWGRRGRSRTGVAWFDDEQYGTCASPAGGACGADGADGWNAGSDGHNGASNQRGVGGSGGEGGPAGGAAVGHYFRGGSGGPGAIGGGGGGGGAGGAQTGGGLAFWTTACAATSAGTGPLSAVSFGICMAARAIEADPGNDGGGGGAGGCGGEGGRGGNPGGGSIAIYLQDTSALELRNVVLITANGGAGGDGGLAGLPGNPAPGEPGVPSTDEAGSGGRGGAGGVGGLGGGGGGGAGGVSVGVYCVSASTLQTNVATSVGVGGPGGEGGGLPDTGPADVEPGHPGAPGETGVSAGAWGCN